MNNEVYEGIARETVEKANASDNIKIWSRHICQNKEITGW